MITQGHWEALLGQVFTHLKPPSIVTTFKENLISWIKLTAPWNKMFAFLNIFDLDLVCGIFARLTTILKQQLLFSFNLRTQRRKVFQPSFLFSCQSERLFGGKSKKAGGPFCHYWGQLKSLLSSFLYDQTLKALTRLYLAELHKELQVFSCC